MPGVAYWAVVYSEGCPSGETHLIHLLASEALALLSHSYVCPPLVSSSPPSYTSDFLHALPSNISPHLAQHLTPPQVLAHLMEESKSTAQDQHTQHAHQQHASAADSAGRALLSFVKRFGGRGFDFENEAVSVRLGGCVSRDALPGGRLGFSKANTFLVLEDPLTGQGSGD